MPSGVNLMRSPVLYRAAQESESSQSWGLLLAAHGCCVHTDRLSLSQAWDEAQQQDNK